MRKLIFTMTKKSNILANNQREKTAGTLQYLNLVES